MLKQLFQYKVIGLQHWKACVQRNLERIENGKRNYQNI